MCGFACSAHSQKSKSELHQAFNRVQYRGPDNSIPLTIDSLEMVFHRLAIMDLSAAGNQPFLTTAHPNLVLICNGEIYNHQELITRYGFAVESESDCEVILHLIARVGLEKTVRELDGVYAFVVYDRANQLLHIGRDPFGVRPCFWGTDEDQALYVASEAKAIDRLVQQVQPFDPGTAATWCLQQRAFAQRITHHADVYEIREETNEQQITEQIRARLTQAVHKRLMSHRELGCLLSGGLDSSLIAALVARHSKQRIKTFSIGLKDSVDLKFARIVADHIGSDHHEIELTEEQFLQAIPQVIHNIESYDTTTVRASVGNYLVSKFIRENSECKVVFNGDGADEVCVGYLYNINAPSDQAIQQEAIRLVRELHYFDVLRSDRSISSNGLEARTPFLDPDFVTYYMGIDPKLKRFDSNRMEKYLLRKAFDGTGLLPDSVLWRRKCAFSDGVSTKRKSWHHIIQEHVDGFISDEDFRASAESYDHCQPQLKESLYYRRVFESLFAPSAYQLIPHFWLPRWSNVIDPSARELAEYEESSVEQKKQTA